MSHFRLGALAESIIQVQMHAARACRARDQPLRTLHQCIGDPIFGEDVSKPSALIGEHHAYQAATWLLQMIISAWWSWSMAISGF